MARANTHTIMPLDRWAELVGINPVHFNGAAGRKVWPVSNSCQFVWPQHAWQTVEEFINRELVAQTLSMAENQIATLMGYFHAPNLITERIAWKGVYSTYRTRRMKVRNIGSFSSRYLGKAVISYRDDDEDMWDETAAFSFTLPEGVDVNDVRVHYPGHSGSLLWEIRPVSLTANNTSLAGTFKTWQAVLPQLQERFPVSDGNLEPIDIDDPANLLTEVELYASVYSASGVNVNTLQTCRYCQDNGPVPYNANLIDPQQGLFSLTPTDCPPCNCGTPTWFDVTYESGLGTPDPIIEQAIALLTLARFNNPPCRCSSVFTQYSTLAIDIADRKNNRFLTIDGANSPLGTRQGEMAVWNSISRLGMFSAWVGEAI